MRPWPSATSRADGREYVITDWRTPRPWSNLIANPRVGLAVSQTGSGFSWIDNSQLAALVRWQQDLGADRSGRFLYRARPRLRRGLVARAGALLAGLRPLRLPARPRLHHVRDRAARSRGGMDPVRRRRARPSSAGGCGLRDVSGRARRLLARAVSGMELRHVAGAAARVPEALPRDPLRRGARARSWPPATCGTSASQRWGHWNTSFPYWTRLRRGAAGGARPPATRPSSSAATAAGRRRRLSRAHRWSIAVRPPPRSGGGTGVRDRARRPAAASRAASRSRPRMSRRRRRRSPAEFAAVAGVGRARSPRCARPGVDAVGRPSDRDAGADARPARSTTGCAIRRSRLACGAGPATTSRAAPTASATSSRIRRSGSPSTPRAAASRCACTRGISSATARSCTGGTRSPSRGTSRG